ncbi:MAG TPA: four helix bundle protein [Gemmatimonadaceae bacterium]
MPSRRAFRFGAADATRRALDWVQHRRGRREKTNAAFAASLYVSFSEAGELLFQLRVSVRLEMGDATLAKKLRADIEQIRRMLLRLIRRLEGEGPPPA